MLHQVDLRSNPQDAAGTGFLVLVDPQALRRDRRELRLEFLQ